MAGGDRGAGYQRSVVSPTPGTTRDVVTTTVAFDGWPVELADTAGLRDAAGLEADGVERAKAVLASADLVVWVLDDSVEDLTSTYPDPATAALVRRPATRELLVRNKADRAVPHHQSDLPFVPAVSALTGDGVPGLAAAVVTRLVPDPPPPGAAVPCAPALAEAVEGSHRYLLQGQTDEAARLLRPFVAEPPTG